MVKNKSINIVQIEAKDIVNAGSGGYTVKSLKRYKGTFDYSLEWIKLKKEAERILVNFTLMNIIKKWMKIRGRRKNNGTIQWLY